MEENRKGWDGLDAWITHIKDDEIDFDEKWDALETEWEWLYNWKKEGESTTHG